MNFIFPVILFLVGGTFGQLQTSPTPNQLFQNFQYPHPYPLQYSQFPYGYPYAAQYPYAAYYGQNQYPGPIIKGPPPEPVVEVIPKVPVHNLTPLDSALLDLDVKKPGHSEKYYYGRSNFGQTQSAGGTGPANVNFNTNALAQDTGPFIKGRNFPLINAYPSNTYVPELPTATLPYQYQFPYPYNTYYQGLGPVNYDINLPVLKKPVMEELSTPVQLGINPIISGAKKPFTVDKKQHYEVYVYE